IIVDEVQELIDEKRGIELSVIIQFLRRNSINKIQLIGISATLGDTEIAKYFLDPEGNVEIIKVDIIKSIKINLEIPRPTKELALKYPEVRLDPKVLARLERLKEIIINNRPVLIFTNTRDTAEFLSSQLALIYGLNVYSHHGSLSREIRTTVESKFREGEIDAVVATSSLELGIDIGKINLVIQYMSPRQVIRLIQRVGRSGHSLDRESKVII
ncbi:MAG: helicase-related protein, partial [Sulfolobaceae archaeon]